MVHFLCLYLFAVIPGLIVFGLGRKRLGLTFLAVMIALVGFGTFVPSINAGNALLKLALITEIGLVIYTVTLVIKTGIASRRRKGPAPDERLKDLIAAYEQNPAAGIAVSFRHPGLRLAAGILLTGLMLLSLRIPGTGIKFKVMCAILAGVTGFMSYIALITFKEPALVFRPDGVTTQMFGLIPWSMIKGIQSSTESISVNRFRSRRHLLNLYVPKLNELTSGFRAGARLLRFTQRSLRNNRLALSIDMLSERPEVIYGAARHLWTKYTGNDYDWDADFSDEANLALRRLNSYEAAPTTSDALTHERDQALVSSATRRKKFKRAFSMTLLIIFLVLLKAYLKF